MTKVFPKTFEELVELSPKIVQRKLEQLRFLRERADFHPEASTYEHIKIVTERLFKTGDKALILTGLLHDICKFDTVRLNPKNGHPTCPGHDQAAYDLIMDADNGVMKFILSFDVNPGKVANLCKEHMRVKQLPLMKPSKQEALKSSDLYPQLEVFTRADDMLKEFTV